MFVELFALVSTYLNLTHVKKNIEGKEDKKARTQDSVFEQEQGLHRTARHVCYAGRSCYPRLLWSQCSNPSALPGYQAIFRRDRTTPCH